EPEHLLRLRAEMRLPGLAWLEMSVEAGTEGRTRYRQRALVHPRGLLGHAYWWSVSPVHAVVFGGMARNITQAAAQGMSARKELPHRPRPALVPRAKTAARARTPRVTAWEWARAVS
ncbi:DUF2867 domain-containing protein, partial [Streptomyces sp. A475]|uniref:DUF2867 domain-containing protein n=1 Tax=Streptomyces sp. A475 TaxID=3131976 RepID=UPI0030C9D808